MLRLVLAVVFAGLLAVPAWAERRVALVVAANDYRTLRPLENALNDGRAVEATLSRLGFEVFPVLNPTLKRLRRSLRDFEEDAEGADVALVFFSGHGVELSGDNRLLPVDADAASLDTLEDTSLALEDVRDAVTEVARIGLIVLDACRSDPFGGTEGGGRGAVALKPAVAAAVKPGLGRMGRAENVLFSFSAAPGETASDGSGGNSEFSAALAKFLPTDGLEIRSVLTLVQQEVYDRTRGKQLPYLESGLPKLFFAAESGGNLPERDRLLLAMADITPALRGEVEKVAAGADMPLAPLYAALITADGGRMREGERRQKLKEAADAFVQVRADLRRFAAADPKVAELRGQAEAKLALGAFEEARALLGQAADIDGESREDLKTRLVERTLSEAATHYLAGGAAHANLRYRLAIGDYRKAADLYAEIEGFGLPPDARARQIAALELIGDMAETVGDLAAAGRAYAEMAAAAERRLGLTPDDIPNARDLVVARNKRAGIQAARGDLAGALQSFEAAREAMLAIVQKEPIPQYVRDLSTSFSRVGDMRRLAGDGAGALVEFRKALQLIDYVAAQVPDDPRPRRELGLAHFKVALGLRMIGDLPGALTETEAALAITQALAVGEPDDAELQRDITVSLNMLGDLRRLSGDEAGALAPYAQGAAITERLVEADPENTLLRSDLAAAFGKLGAVKAATGDLSGALTDFRSGLALAVHLGETDPANAEWQRSIAIAHGQVGDALLQQGDRQGAADEYRAASAIAETLHAAAPADAQRVADAAYARYKLGTAGIEPDKNFRAALDTLEKLKAENRLPGPSATWIAMVQRAIEGLAPK